jgi:hypothetical protein
MTVSPCGLSLGPIAFCFFFAFDVGVWVFSVYGVFLHDIPLSSILDRRANHWREFMMVSCVIVMSA